MLRLCVHVTPRSGRDEVVGWKGDELQIRVTVAAEGGKANAAVCKLVAKSLGIAKSSVRIARGETSRHKALEIEGVESDDISRAFGEADDSLF